MLLKRVLTASVLAALVIVAVFKLPALLFSLFIAIITFIAAWEWLALTGVDSLGRKLLFFGAMLVPMFGVTYWTELLELLSEAMEWPEIKDYSDVLEWLVFAPVLFWILTMVLIRQTGPQLLTAQFSPRLQAFLGWLVLMSAWMFLSKLRAYYGSGMVIYLLLLIWAADISAYFAGKKWGTDKLAPEISPGKTIQGMYGALVSAVVCGIGFFIYGKTISTESAQAQEGMMQFLDELVFFDMLMLSVFTVLISIYGDLFFSLVKRRKGVKDSGSLLPGHGGVLDRIDSIVAATPFFYAGILLIGRIFYS
ncbi:MULTISPECIES: phosphatidate cytidylyltransferase [Methylomonas]|uniref:Phosphatidate cytidylyltransferase n=1 Tax=Methylomonas koyamae TaxID=702114 RepID=A0A177NG29_9GAMM|nr:MULTISPECIES: phosphatidate cytidylyltransferase [Methylomonas]NJA05070.1 phosphatidate cytidylyltransferase [Methylococcaceae bacterium WWC4]OAI16010.1 phosphatidate cytidylyltransferase [Methylomonas koyamae]OHX36915.1 phosphatidate cytidylyltransferase [Methylomonas sp. LWB]WGS84129.1 phosphatidate cytidylyltransferase [Methylomonas sp. UP202]